MVAPVSRVLHRDEPQSPLFQSDDLVLLLFPIGFSALDLLLLLLSPFCGLQLLCFLLWVSYTESTHLVTQHPHPELVVLVVHFRLLPHSTRAFRDEQDVVSTSDPVLLDRSTGPNHPIAVQHVQEQVTHVRWDAQCLLYHYL